MFDSVCELFGGTIHNMLGGFVILLLNVVELLSLVGVLYWIDPVWSSIECVCWACRPRERLDAPSICLVCVFGCRK